MSIRKRVLVRDLPDARQNETFEDLLVFGYQCKLFRDDDRAQFIEDGKHLIPWMGDASLLIDRYDGRGHLHDLRPHDADDSRGQTPELSAEERRLEKMCDEERYLELYTDVQEKMTYEEEEAKRQKEGSVFSGYSAVGFSYDQSALEAQQEQQATKDASEEDSEPYVPIPELQVPTTIDAPATMKLHAIIEKTATFVSQHGSQMEIVIKTKQKDNPQFQFLNFDSGLNPYYKHMVSAIKSGRYKPKAKRERRDSDGMEGDGYLHPSLSKTVTQAETAASRQEFLTSVSTKLPAGQIANTPYAKLLSNLRKHQRGVSPDPSLLSTQAANGNGSTTCTSNDSIDAESKLSAEEPPTILGQPPPPGTEPPAPLPPVPLPQPAEEPDIDISNVLEPPTDARQVVDKMADYVARNGPEFEVIVKVKKDERFQFLEDWHPYHPYYQCVKSKIIKEMDPLKAKEGPVSFSIKSKDVDAPGAADLRSVLPYDDSSEDDANNVFNGEFDIRPPPPPPLEPPPLPNKPPPPDERKLAQERLRDKLAQAAREKLAQAAKDKALQAERKRKVAMFLSMVGKAKPPSVAPNPQANPPVQGPVEPPPSLRVQRDEPEEAKPSRSRSGSPRNRSHYRRSRSRSGSRNRSKRSHHRSSRHRRSRSRSRSRRSKKKSRRHSRSRSRERRSSKRTRRSSPSRRVKRRRRSTSSETETPKPSESPPKFCAIPEIIVPKVEVAEPAMRHSSKPYSESETSQNGSSDENKIKVEARTSLSEEDSNSRLSVASGPPQAKVSSDLLSKVRAMLKASREAVLKEDQLEATLPVAPVVCNPAQSSDSDSS